jgi:hypothetical protein
MTVRHWLKKRLATLIANYYAATIARAIAALPHDELDVSG